MPTERAVALDPASSDLRWHLHDVLRWFGSDEEDEEQLRAGLTREAESPSLLAALGQSLIAQGRLDDGLACCRAALKLDPDHDDARLARGRASFLAGRYAIAWPDRYRLVKGLDKRPTGTSGREWEGQNLYVTEYETTAEDMETAIGEMRSPERAPTNALFYEWRDKAITLHESARLTERLAVDR